MLSDPPTPPRAGFWRRLGAFAVDTLVGGLVIAVFGTLAFALSGGRIQTGPFGVIIQSCSNLTAIPAGLTPPPPDGSNFGSICSSGSFPGLAMTRSLLLGRSVANAGTVVKTWRSYMISTDGSPAAFDASGIGDTLFIAYLGFALCVRGQTIGMMLLRTRMIVPVNSERRGVPLFRLAIRAAVMVGGFLPAVAVGAVILLWTQHDPEHAPVFVGILASVMGAAIWMLWNAILIGRKLDPLYNRYSGLAVVRLPDRIRRNEFSNPL